MADNDVLIKLSLDGDTEVASGLAGVGDGASQADSKLGSLVGGGLKGAGVALAGLAAAGVAAGAALSGAVISSYADYEQNLGGIETMFGDSTDKMVAFADEAYKSAGLSANEYMSQVTSFSASLLQGLEGDTNAASDAANLAMTDMSDNANKFGTNIGDIQNAYQGFAKQNFTMLDNLKLGYGGTKEEMQRLMDDAEKLPAAMGQEFDLDNFADVTQAIHLIQEEMGIAGTTALEASETISGSVGMLKGSFDNLLTGLGDADADVATLAGNVITSLETVVANVGPVIENLGSNMETLGPQMGTMLEGLIESVAGAIPGMLGAGVSMIGGLIEGISSSLPGLITAIVPAVVGIVEMLATQAPLLLSAGLEAIGALATGIAEALPTLIPIVVEGVVGLVSALVENLPMLLDAGLQLITGLGEGLLAALPVLIEALPQIITGLVDFIAGATPQLVDAGLQLLLGLVEAIPEVMTALSSAMPELVIGVVTGLLNSIPMLAEAGIQLFLGLITALPEIIVGIVEAIPQIVDGLVNGVVEAWPALAEAGQGLFDQMIANAPEFIQNIAGEVPNIISGIVSAIGAGFGNLVTAGVELFQKMVQNIGIAISFIKSRIPQIITGIVTSIAAGASSIVAKGTEVLNGIVSGISGVVSNVRNAVTSVISTITSTLTGAVSTVFTIGSNIVQGIANGISGGADAVMSAIGGVVNGAVDWAKGLLGIKSPSRVFMAIGKHLTTGFSIGMIQDSKKVKDSATKLVTLVKDSFAKLAAERVSLQKQGTKLHKSEADLNKKLQDELLKQADIRRQISSINWGDKGASDKNNSLNKQLDSSKAKAGELSKKIKGVQKDILGVRAQIADIDKSTGHAEVKARATQRKALQDEGTRLHKKVAEFTKRQQELMKAPKTSANKKELDFVNKTLDIANKKILKARAGIKAIDKASAAHVSTQNKILAEITKQEKALAANAKQREKIAKQLDNESKKLAELKDQYNDYVASTQGDVVDLGSVAEFLSPESMIKNLEKTESRTKQFQDTMKKLIAMGIDDTTMQQITDEFLSTGQLSQANNLLEGGPAMVKKIADLQKRVSAEGKKLGTLVGKDMYQAGIDAQSGLVKGLTSNLNKLDAAAKKLSDALVAAVKKSLKIKSPSKLMASEIGQWIPAGVGEGIVDNISSAVSGITAMNKALVSEAESLSFSPAVSSATPTPSMVPATYTATVSSPSGVSPAALREGFAALAASQATGANVDVNTNVTMIDRDPRLVGAQIGRSIQGVLNG